MASCGSSISSSDSFVAQILKTALELQNDNATAAFFANEILNPDVDSPGRQAALLVAGSNGKGKGNASAECQNAKQSTSTHSQTRPSDTPPTMNANKPDVRVISQAASGQRRVLMHAYPRQALEAASWTADAVLNIPSKNRAENELTLPGDRVDDPAIFRVLSWILSKHPPFPYTYKGHPQVPFHQNETLTELAHVYMVCLFLRLKPPFSQQYVLRKRIMDLIIRRDVTMQEVANIYICLSGYDDQLVRICLHKVVDQLDNTHPNQWKTWLYYFGYVRGLKEKMETIRKRKRNRQAREHHRRNQALDASLDVQMGRLQIRGQH